jgi:hypothetical protein
MLVSDVTALDTHESMDVGVKTALVMSCTLSPLIPTMTATFRCADLTAATADGDKLPVFQNGLNTPLVGVGVGRVPERAEHAVGRRRRGLLVHWRVVDGKGEDVVEGEHGVDGNVSELDADELRADVLLEHVVVILG